jgi:hypothetical protein
MAGCSMATSEGAEARECGDAGRGGDLVVWSGAFRFRPGGMVGLVWGGWWCGGKDAFWQLQSQHVQHLDLRWPPSLRWSPPAGIWNKFKVTVVGIMRAKS